jgi:hypothetical protein
MVRRAPGRGPTPGEPPGNFVVIGRTGVAVDPTAIPPFRTHPAQIAVTRDPLARLSLGAAGGLPDPPSPYPKPASPAGGRLAARSSNSRPPERSAS